MLQPETNQDIGRQRHSDLLREARRGELALRLAEARLDERRSFLELLSGDKDVTDHLGPDELKACFDPAWYLRHVDTIFRRAGLL